MLNCDRYLLPTNLEEALQAYRSAPSGSRILAGATDTLPWAREGRAGDVHVPTIVDVSRIGELDGYTIADGRVRLGANVVFQSFLMDETLRRHLPCMPYCAIWFADDQIREQATVVGNVVNASPAADGTPPLVAMNAVVEVAGLGDAGVTRRKVPLDGFVTGPGRTVLELGEIVTAIECESMEGYGGAFEKVGQRRSLVISSVCTAALVKVSRDGRRFEDLRLAMGGIGPLPCRLTDIEEKLRGQEIDRAAIIEAGSMAVDRVASRTRREYRRDVVRGFVERAIEDALVDCGALIPPSPEKETARA